MQTRYTSSMRHGYMHNAKHGDPWSLINHETFNKCWFNAGPPSATAASTEPTLVHRFVLTRLLKGPRAGV